MNDPNQGITLQKLLTWGISNATAAEDPTVIKENLEKIDPKWIDIVLGKPDAVRMKDNMATILNESLSIEDRLNSFDDLELLVESIDNANDLKICQLWEPLLQLFRHPNAEIRKYAAWVTATAIQNNPQATKHFIEAKGVLLLLDRIDQETETSVMAKLINITTALVNQSHEFIPLLHRRGVLQKFMADLLVTPPHAHAPRLFHFFSVIFCPETVDKLGKPHMEELVPLLRDDTFRRLIEIHIDPARSLAAIEDCLNFLTAFLTHPILRLSKEMGQKIVACIDFMDIDAALKEKFQRLAQA